MKVFGAFSLLTCSSLADVDTCDLQRGDGTCFQGNTIATSSKTEFGDCCAKCKANSDCTHFTINLDDKDGTCRLKNGQPSSKTSSERCTSGTAPPPVPTPVPPAPPPPAPVDPTAPKPNIIAIFADDLGWYDTALYNPNSPTPHLVNLSKQGVMLDRHYVFRYCSPTRRSFLSGRFPNHITTVQPDGSNMCSDFLPLDIDIMPQKLRTAGYVSHFVGKGHLGYETMDHLPINRGFASHVGFLGGSESYHWGNGDQDPTTGKHDIWHGDHPGIDVVPQLEYATDYYTQTAVNLINTHDQSKPMFMYFAIQNVHSPYQLPPAWQVQDFPNMWDHTYANMVHMLDKAVANVTDALVGSGMWDNTLIMFTADNGAVGKFGNNHPLRGHKHDPWEGGTRVAAFISGGFVPENLRGTRSGDKFVHVSDWYPTFCALAGVDPRDDVYLSGKYRHIDGVNVWPMLTGGNMTQPRAITPTSEAGIFEIDGTKWWKLVTLAGNSNYYTENNTEVATNDPCLDGAQIDPPQPGRTDAIVNGPAESEGKKCPVCNATMPCLYDILADPKEEKNIAAMHPDIVARLQPLLDAYNDHYVVGHLDAARLATNYTKIDASEWQGYTGPCYRRKEDTLLTV